MDSYEQMIQHLVPPRGVGVEYKDLTAHVVPILLKAYHFGKLLGFCILGWEREKAKGSIRKMKKIKNKRKKKWEREFDRVIEFVFDVNLKLSIWIGKGRIEFISPPLFLAFAFSVRYLLGAVCYSDYTWWSICFSERCSMRWDRPNSLRSASWKPEREHLPPSPAFWKACNLPTQRWWCGPEKKQW